MKESINIDENKVYQIVLEQLEHPEIKEKCQKLTKEDKEILSVLIGTLAMLKPPLKEDDFDKIISDLCISFSDRRSNKEDSN